MNTFEDLAVNQQEIQVRQLVCRQHDKKVEKMCLAFDCKNQTRLLCIDCCLDHQRHSSHREQIISLDKMIHKPKQVMEELKYRGIEKKELKKLNESEYEKIIHEVWEIMSEGLKQILERGRIAIRKLNEHIEAANTDDMDEIFNGISLDSFPTQKKEQNEIEQVLQELFNYSINKNESILEDSVNKHLQEMYRKQKLSREIIVPDLQKDIRLRLHVYAKDMLHTSDSFIQNNIIQNNNEIIRNEGVSIQAPFKNETIRDLNDLQSLIHKNDETINSLMIQRRVSIYENIEDAFHIIPSNITKINYLLDADSRNFFQKIKYIPSTVKTIEISGTRPNFDAFKLPKSIQNLKLTLKQVQDMSKVIDGFIRYTPQKLQSLELCFSNCQATKRQINHLIQSFKYLPITLKTYILRLNENQITAYSITKLILYSRYLPKSVYKVQFDVCNQLGNHPKINSMNYPQYEALNLLDQFPQQDVFKKLNDEKLQKANLYYGVDQSMLEYSFVREFMLNLSQNLFEEQHALLYQILFKVFSNLSKFELILDSCNIQNRQCEIIGSLILEMPQTVKIADISLNGNNFNHLGLQFILEAIDRKKDQFSNFKLHFENCPIGNENITILKSYILQQQIRLEIIC